MGTETLAKELTGYVMAVRSERPDWTPTQCIAHVLYFHRRRIEGELEKGVALRLTENFIDQLRSYNRGPGKSLLEAKRRMARPHPDIFEEYEKKIKGFYKLSYSDPVAEVEKRKDAYMERIGEKDMVKAYSAVLKADRVLAADYDQIVKHRRRVLYD